MDNKKIYMSDIAKFSNNNVQQMQLVGTSCNGIETHKSENGQNITTLKMIEDGIIAFTKRVENDPLLYMDIERLNKWKYYIHKYLEK